MGDAAAAAEAQATRLGKLQPEPEPEPAPLTPRQQPLSRGEEARARLAAVRAAEPPAAQGDGKDAGEEEDESLESYAARRLQLASLPRVQLSTAELDAVYEPSDDTFLLLDALEADRARLRASNPALCVEIGCGSGVVITSLGAMLPAARCMALDINTTALAVARRTAAANAVPSLELVRGDLLTAFRCFEYRREPTLIDVLVFNPPYVPSEPDEIGLGCSWAPKLSAAWAGGVDGREIIDRLLPQLRGRIAPTGSVYMVLEALNKPQEVAAALQEHGFRGEVVRRTDVVHEEAPERLEIWRFTPAAPHDQPEPEPEPEQDDGETEGVTARQPASAAARRAVATAASAGSREAAAEELATRAVGAETVAAAVVSQAESEREAQRGEGSPAARTLVLAQLPAAAGLRDVHKMLEDYNARTGLEIVFRLEEAVAEAVYATRGAAAAAAAALANAQLISAVPHVSLKVADAPDDY